MRPADFGVSTLAFFRSRAPKAGPAELICAAAQRYRGWFDAGNLAAIWNDREGLESSLRVGMYGMSAAELDQLRAACGAAYFWHDAYPAYAGLKSGKKFGTNVFQYAGNADAHVDRSDPAQVELMDQIDRLARA